MNENEELEEQPKEEEQPKRPPRKGSFTKENAAMMARRAQVSRRNRKQYRDAMFRTLVEKMDLGEELVKAIQRGDETLVTVLEKAVKMVGLHFDQSDEYKQNISMKTDSEVKLKGDGSIKFIIEEAKPEA